MAKIKKLKIYGVEYDISGDNGITPHIGDNGNWWIGDEDTGVTAQGGSTDSVAEVAPRAMIRHIVHYDKDKKKNITFEDVFASNADSKVWSQIVYGLEAHGTSSITQDVYISYDGGETWKAYATFTIDAANGKWFTDIFVDQKSNVMYLLKTTDGFTGAHNQVCTFAWNGSSWYQSGTLEIGKRKWLGNNNSIDVGVNAAWSERAVIFGEYQTTTDGTTYSLWKTTNNGVAWRKVLELAGDNDGVTGTGEIRHWHTVQYDPHSKHWWATSGDVGNQCQMWRSTDNGETWNLIMQGTQQERTCGFVFESNYIYYAMDSTRADKETETKIFRINRQHLEAFINGDIAGDYTLFREEVATVDSGYAVYGLSRTEYPRGFIVWSQYENGASVIKNRHIVQFYDYGTKKLYPIARIDTSNIAKNQYIGFYAGARMQNIYSGVVFARPTYSVHQSVLGTSISTHVKVNLTN